MATNTLVSSTPKGSTATGTTLFHKTTQLSQKANHTTKSTVILATTEPPVVKPKQDEDGYTEVIAIAVGVPVGLIAFIVIGKISFLYL